MKNFLITAFLFLCLASQANAQAKLIVRWTDNNGGPFNGSATLTRNAKGDQWIAATTEPYRGPLGATESYGRWPKLGWPVKFVRVWPRDARVIKDGQIVDQKSWVVEFNQYNSVSPLMVPTEIVSQENHPSFPFVFRASGEYQPSSVKKTYSIAVTVQPSG